MQTSRSRSLMMTTSLCGGANHQSRCEVCSAAVRDDVSLADDMSGNAARLQKSRSFAGGAFSTGFTGALTTVLEEAATKRAGWHR